MNIKNNKIKTLVKDLILQAKRKREQNGISKVDHARSSGISLTSLYKVEDLKCHDLKIIDKYIK